MKIELIIDDITVSYGSGTTCFDTPTWVADKAREVHTKPFSGKVIIDNVAIAFSYSPYFNDGDITNTNANYKCIVKNLVTAYAMNLLRPFYHD